VRKNRQLQFANVVPLSILANFAVGLQPGRPNPAVLIAELLLGVSAVYSRVIGSEVAAIGLPGLPYSLGVSSTIATASSGAMSFHRKLMMAG